MRLQDRLRTIITTQIKAGEDLPDFTDHDDLFAKGVLSSLEILDLVITFEDNFGVKIPAYEVVEQNFGSLDAMASYLTSKGVAG